MRETIEILCDPLTMADLADAAADVATGRTTSLAEVAEELRQLGRLE